jgi:hypothetical protein
VTVVVLVDWVVEDDELEATVVVVEDVELDTLTDTLEEPPNQVTPSRSIRHVTVYVPGVLGAVRVNVKVFD